MDPYSPGYQPVPSNNNQLTPNEPVPYNPEYPVGQPSYTAQPAPYYNAGPANQPYNQQYAQPYAQPYNNQYSPQQSPYSQPYNEPYVQQKQSQVDPEKPIVITVETEPIYRGQPFSPMVTDGQSRLRFVRKVLLIVTCQLLLVTAICAFCMFTPHVSDYLQSYDGQWVFWLAFSAEIIFLILLFIVRKHTPWNFGVLIIFTASTGFLVGQTVTYYTVPSVFEAFIITVLTTVGLVGYVYITKSDFSLLGPGIFCLSKKWCTGE
jgi:hypothetical protein